MMIFTKFFQVFCNTYGQIVSSHGEVRPGSRCDGSDLAPRMPGYRASVIEILPHLRVKKLPVLERPCTQRPNFSGSQSANLKIIY